MLLEYGYAWDCCAENCPIGAFVFTEENFKEVK
jgi:hypothetical protein